MKVKDKEENITKEEREEKNENIFHQTTLCENSEAVVKKREEECTFIGDTTTTTTTFAYKKGGWGARHTVVLLACVGITLMCMMRYGLSIAIVAMVAQPAAPPHSTTTAAPNTTGAASTPLLGNSTTSSSTAVYEWVDDDGGGGGVCPAPDGGGDGNGTVDGNYNDTITRFEWDERTQGHVLGAYYYGYILTNILGGRMAERVGSKLIVLLGMLLSSLLSLVSPLAAHLSTGVFIGVRLLQGVAQGVLLPAFNRCLVMWVPPFKRAKYNTLVFIGLELGIVLSMATGGFLCSQPSLGGWAAVFYVFGGAGAVWCVAWGMLARDSPLQNNRISTWEKQYLSSHCEAQEEQVSVAWGQVLRSPPFWAITVMHLGYNWGYYTLASQLPVYMANMQHFTVRSNGIVSALPYVVSTVVALLFSMAMDRATARGLLSVLTVRRLAMAVASYIPAAALVGMCLVGCDSVMAVAVMCVAVGTAGCAFSGLFSSHQDIAPNLAGTLLGVTNCIATVTGFLAPALVGFITYRNQTVWAWNTVFLLSATIYLVSATFYIKCITDQVQPFNDPVQVTKQPGERKSTKQLPPPQLREDLASNSV